MCKYFTENSTRKYIVTLDALVDQCNNTLHSLIKMTPVEASLKKMKMKFGGIYIQNLVVRP